MKNTKFFLTSFNRPNLSYEVRIKTKKTTEEIAYYIKSKPKQTGLIYCISRKDCENLAKNLNDSFEIKAGFYHADLPSEKKNLIQQQWMQGEVQVLIATIAFGMGIDKKDCRFVIHFSLPRSLEGYYQESGRAGRDGKQAECILYFSYGDKMKQDFLITKSSHHIQQQEKSFKELNNVINYCEDIYTCRRKMQLEYLGENFDSKECNKTCDNCISEKISYEKNVTEAAIKIANILKGPRHGLNTLLQVASLLKGGNIKKNELIKTHEAFASLNDYSKEDIERILRKMVYLDIIKEKSVKNYKNVYNTVIELGSTASKLLENELIVTITCECKKPIIYVPDMNQIALQGLNDFKYKDPNYEEEKYLLNNDQIEELKERIELVVRGIAKKTNKKPQEILSTEKIIEICKFPPDNDDNIPKEVLKEILYFKNITADKENLFNFDVDLTNINIEEFEYKKDEKSSIQYKKKSKRIKNKK